MGLLVLCLHIIRACMGSSTGLDSQGQVSRNLSVQVKVVWSTWLLAKLSVPLLCLVLIELIRKDNLGIWVITRTVNLEFCRGKQYT